MSDLITRNLSDQSQNFGQETVVENVNGLRQFVDQSTGQVVRRNLLPDAYDLAHSPLDNSFQLDPQVYNQSTNLFEQPSVPGNLSRTYGAITAVTAKQQGVSPQQLFVEGRMSNILMENVNFFRSAHSKIGFNDQQTSAPWLNNLLLGSKILSQTQ